jgi:hypothetical protein
MSISPRLAGVCGVVFVVLSAAIAVTAPPLPSLAASGTDVVTYFANHHWGFLIGNYLGAVALLFGLPLFVHLTLAVRDGERDGGWLWILVVLTAAAATGFSLTVFTLFQVAAMEAPNLPAATAKALSVAAGMSFAFDLLPIAAVMASLALGFLVTRVMNVWIGRAGLAGAAVCVIASLGTLTTNDPLAAGGAVTLVAFSAFVAWFLWISVVLLRRDAQPSSG